MHFPRSISAVMALSLLLAQQQSTVALPIGGEPLSDGSGVRMVGTDPAGAAQQAAAASTAAAGANAADGGRQAGPMMAMISHGDGGPVHPQKQTEKGAELKKDTKKAGKKEDDREKGKGKGKKKEAGKEDGKTKGKKKEGEAKKGGKKDAEQKKPAKKGDKAVKNGGQGGGKAAQGDKEDKDKSPSSSSTRPHDGKAGGKNGKPKKGGHAGREGEEDGRTPAMVPVNGGGGGGPKSGSGKGVGPATAAGVGGTAAAAAAAGAAVPLAAAAGDNVPRPDVGEAMPPPTASASSSDFPAAAPFNATSSLATSAHNGTAEASHNGTTAVAGSSTAATATLAGGSSNSTSSLAGAGTGALVPRTRFCAQPENTNKTIDTLTLALVKKEKARLAKIRKAKLGTDKDRGGAHALTNAQILAEQKKTVPLVFHVIHDKGAGNLTAAAVQKQVDVLNADYDRFGFAFSLNATNYVDNAKWYRNVVPGSTEQDDMKTTLHRGDERTLNMYSVNFPNNLLGYATFPWDARSNLQQDGVVFQYSTVPDGAETGYNMGKTATHEVGHWLGLYHVFQGGCGEPGDLVDDTPPQSTATSGCPTRQDSCPGGGVDSIHNYMDYSNDECLTEFTDGQAVRMAAIVSEYRGL